ncbi:MAG TPA: hypothetical protein VF763_04415 [Candidatus Limnocylindrales bacterium]
MWRPRTAAAIAAIFVVAGLVYWFGSGYLDPAGTVLLIWAGLAIGFGYLVIFRGSRGL